MILPTLLITATLAAPALGGAPELTRVDAHHAQLRFVVQNPPTPLDAKIAFAGGQRVAAPKDTGKRHGYDPIYTAKVTTKTAWHVGSKYTVRFTFAGGKTTTTKVKLRG
jgi:hypothetical protein